MVTRPLRLISPGRSGSNVEDRFSKVQAVRIVKVLRSAEYFPVKYSSGLPVFGCVVIDYNFTTGCPFYSIFGEGIDNVLIFSILDVAISEPLY